MDTRTKIVMLVGLSAIPAWAVVLLAPELYPALKAYQATPYLLALIPLGLSALSLLIAIGAPT